MKKKYKQQPPTTYTIDADGQRLAHVALSGSDQRATLYAEDLERLLGDGWSPYWSLTSTGGRFRYVLAHAANPSGRQRSITIARLIAAAVKGFRVEYIDGDRCNLRRENLRAVKGGGHAPTAAAALHPGTVEFLIGKTEKAETNEGPVLCQGAEMQAAVSPSAVFAPRVVNRAALSARVRDRMTAAGPETCGENFRDGI